MEQNQMQRKNMLKMINETENMFLEFQELRLYIETN